MTMNQTEQSLNTFIQLIQASNKLEKIVRQDVTQYQLNITEFAVMELLFHKGKQTIQVIKEKILIASSSTTYVIDQLEKKGFVTRQTNINDKRVTFVLLTERGTLLMKEIFPKHAKTITDSMSCLEPNELEQLLKLLAKLNRSLGK